MWEIIGVHTRIRNIPNLTENVNVENSEEVLEVSDHIYLTTRELFDINTVSLKEASLI